MIFFLTVIYVLASLGIAFLLVDLHFFLADPSSAKVVWTLILFFLFWPLIFVWFGLIVIKDLLAEFFNNLKSKS